MGQPGGNNLVLVNQSGEGDSGQKPAEGNQQGGNQAEPLPPPVEQSTTPSESGKAKAEVYTEQPDPLQVRDVTAQEDMVFWAALMFAAALATFLVTSIGTFLIWRQVMLTRQAVEDTGEATDAMREANDIAREAMYDQGRPWIFVETISTNGDAWRQGVEPFTWAFRIVNHGGGLALIDRVEATLPLYDVLPPKEGYVTTGGNEAIAQFRSPHLDLHDFLDGTLVLKAGGPGVEFSERGQRALTMRADIPEKLRAEREMLYTLTAGPGVISWWLLGKITYRDARNHPHETGFCFQHRFPNCSVSEQGGNERNYRT